MGILKKLQFIFDHDLQHNPTLTENHIYLQSEIEGNIALLLPPSNH